MAKSYEVLHDTRLRGRAYASGSQAILGEEDAAGYIRAGLVKGDVPPPPETAFEPESVLHHEAPVVKKKRTSKE